MNKIKIPKDWELKQYEYEDGYIKITYEDKLGNEHIYINTECDMSLPSYDDLQQRIDKAIFYMNNYIKFEELNEPVKIEFGEVIKILRGGD